MFTAPSKFVLVVVAIVLTGLGFYLLDWKHRLAELGQLEQQSQQIQQELRESREAVESLPELGRQLELLEADLARLKTSPFDEEAQAVVANYVAELEALVLTQREATKDRSFSIVSITPGAAEGRPFTRPDALSGLPVRVFQMQLTGQFATLTDFLDQLGMMKPDRLVAINKITLTPQSAEAGLGPVLSVSIPITAYLRQGPRG